MIDLGDLPGGVDQSVANAINSRGQVVGEVSSATGHHAFLWSPTTPNGTTGSMVDLGALPGEFSISAAHDINSHGQVVGDSGPGCCTRAFLWTPEVPNGSTGTMIDLNDVLDPASRRSWRLRNATAINDLGQIVAIGVSDDGIERSLLLTPVPEPSALTLGTVGLLILKCMIRQMKTHHRLSASIARFGTP
jgi:probable HAF family extracellular repeat protein